MANYRGRVTKVVGNEVYVSVADLGVDQDYGPCEVVEGQYAEGDFVLVNQIWGAAEDVVIVGPLHNEMFATGNEFPANPATNDSYLIGDTDGSKQWQSPADAKTALGILTKPASMTSGRYLKVNGAASVTDATTSTMRTDLSIDQVTNTADSAKPVSTAQQTALDLKRNLAPTVYSTGQNFNTLTTPGEYIWSAGYGSNTNAPETNLGMLTVFGAAATMLAQRFISNTTGYTYSRSYNGTTWTSWIRLNYVPPTLYNDIAVCSSATTMTAAATVYDITGMTLSVPVTSTSNVFFVYLVFDAQTISTGSGNFVGRLNVGGTEQTAQAVAVHTTISGLRNTAAQNYRITGLSAGTVTFKAAASSTAAGKYQVNATHSTIIVDQRS